MGRNKSENKISESKFWYIELKYYFREVLDHGFKYLRWIVCWDFDKNINGDTEFAALQENDVRHLEVSKADGKTTYFLNSKTSAVKIQVIRLREFVEENLAIRFSEQ